MSANARVSEVLYEIGELLTIKGDRFRSRAYNMAAQRVRTLTEDVRRIRERGELEEIPGVGKSIAAVIEEVLDTGQSTQLEDLREALPTGVRDLMELEGIGPKKALRFQQELGIATIDDLEAAIKAGRLRDLKGFGEKTEENLLRSIEEFRTRQGRFLLGAVLPVIEEILSYLSSSEAVLEAEVAGSARRRMETVGDLDILAASLEPEKAVERFVTMPPVTRVLSQGTTKSTVVLEKNLQVDLRVIPPEDYGAALQYFTGSKEHNVELRTIAVKMGYKLSEYGLFERDTNRVVASRTEEEIYRALGMDPIPPELRENRGEIEAAAEGRLPELVEVGDIRGDLHVHTKWSDGTATIEEIASRCAELGLEYFAVCDHSKSLGIARGLDEKRLREQGAEIDRLNEGLESFTVLKGFECDIKADGSLDLPDKALKDLDFLVASVHSGFKATVEEMTERIVGAIHNDYVSCIGHPTGRLIQKRQPYELNLKEVFDAAAAQGVMMEINAFPDRLDLDDVNSRAAMERGLVMSIGTDAHTLGQLDFLPLGVSVARRGWLEAKDVANTLSAKEFLKKLGRG
ncbi:MAG: DNA polymerase/3'-5' exonuclease PolX [Candidatus Bathyarchaeota archaeon]|nr:DNA polymerase/3'-5' exonuclease PolX [Candidatus Bathyarchaeota archaeon]